MYIISDTNPRRKRLSTATKPRNWATPHTQRWPGSTGYLAFALGARHLATRHSWMSSWINGKKNHISPLKLSIFHGEKSSSTWGPLGSLGVPWGSLGSLESGAITWAPTFWRVSTTGIVWDTFWTMTSMDRRNEDQRPGQRWSMNIHDMVVIDGYIWLF